MDNGNSSVINKLHNSFIVNQSKIPLIMQNESSECGLACVAMLSCFYKREIDLTTLRQKFSISARGATLEHLIKIASMLNLTARAVKLDIEHLTSYTQPLILHWEMKHFVVLCTTKNGKYYINDPAIGHRVVSVKEVESCFTGVALELVPNSEFVKINEKKTLRFQQFWATIVGLKRSLIIILVWLCSL